MSERNRRPMVPGQRLRRRCAVVIFAGVLLFMGGAPGCVAIQRILADLFPVDDGSDGADDGENGTDGDRPAVLLSASNPTPQLNEEVVLTCSIAAGDPTDAVFDFEPQFGSLIVDPQAGTASFIVAESDLGVSRTFTCTAENQFGVSDLSNPVIVTPTAVEPPVPPAVP